MPRPSHVRDAIRDLILGSDRHDWSAEDIQTALAARGIAADFSSVCRGLNFLESKSALRRVELGDGKARYEAQRHHHDHVRCELCGSVAEVPGCLLTEAHRQVGRATGFLVTGHSLLFSGVCAGCVEGQELS